MDILHVHADLPQALEKKILISYAPVTIEILIWKTMEAVIVPYMYQRGFMKEIRKPSPFQKGGIISRMLPKKQKTINACHILYTDAKSVDIYVQENILRESVPSVRQRKTVLKDLSENGFLSSP